MYCRKCGTQIPTGGKFCPKCGTPDDLGPSYSTNIMPSPKEKNKNARKMAISFLAPIVFITLIIMIVYFNSVDRDLIGRWEIMSDESPEYMEFYSDGTMVMGDDYSLDPNDGDNKFNYKVSQGNLILNDGETTIEFGYHLQDDYLELSVDGGGIMTYHKL